MDDRLAELELRLAAVEQRLDALERVRAPLPATAAPPAATRRAASLSGAATHLGRVLLILGGAYLLRAITDYGFLPTRAGVPIGAAYALLWLFAAYRAAGAAQQRAQAVLYGAVSVALALPVLAEAVTRFELLSGALGAIALTVFCALALVVAMARDLRSLAWVTTLGGLVTALVLLKASRAAVPFAAFLLVLGLGALWIVYRRRWPGLQWLGALGANAGVTILAVLGANEHWSVAPLAAWYIGVALWTAYLMSFALRTQWQRREAGVFEAVQAVAASAIAFSVAARAAPFGPWFVAVPAVLSIALGIGAYALAFAPAHRAERGRNFFFYSTLGLGLVVGGSAMMLSPTQAAAAWSLLAVATAWGSGRYRRVSLSLHCTVLVVAAGVGSGVLSTGLLAFAGDAFESWPVAGASQLLVAVTTVICLFVPVAQRSARWGPLAGLPQLVVLALSVWIVGGLMVTYAAPLLAAVPGPTTDPGTLAALRTGVLTMAATTLALSSRHWRWPEARWLAYPVLVVVGIKLVLEDFPHGRPLTLFIALALVGAALIVVSKLLPQRNVAAGAAA